MIGFAIYDGSSKNQVADFNNFEAVIPFVLKNQHMDIMIDCYCVITGFSVATEPRMTPLIRTARFKYNYGYQI